MKCPYFKKKSYIINSFEQGTVLFVPALVGKSQAKKQNLALMDLYLGDFKINGAGYYMMHNYISV